MTVAELLAVKHFYKLKLGYEVIYVSLVINYPVQRRHSLNHSYLTSDDSLQLKARTLLRRLERITVAVSKAPALNSREPRVVVCASGCISHT